MSDYSPTSLPNEESDSDLSFSSDFLLLLCLFAVPLLAADVALPAPVPFSDILFIATFEFPADTFAN